MNESLSRVFSGSPDNLDAPYTKFHVLVNHQKVSTHTSMKRAETKAASIVQGWRDRGESITELPRAYLWWTEGRKNIVQITQGH